MAALYLKSGGGNFTAAGTWSTTSAAGVDNSGPPLASTDCILELASGALTIDAGAVCRSIDCTSGTGSYTGTVTHSAAVTLTIGDSTAGAGNVLLRFSAGMTYTKGSATTSDILLISSSTNTQTFTTGGKVFANFVINNANMKIQLGDNYVSGGNAWTVTAANSIDMNGKTISINATNVFFTGGGLTYSGLVSFPGGGNTNIAGVNIFSGGINRTGTATLTGALILNANQTISGGNFTLTGNSVINRIIVRSDIFGTTRTITNSGSTNVWSNVDFRDITLGTAYDASAITGKSGDCGGNTNITFTTGANQFYQTAVSANYSDSTKWFLATNGGGGAGRVPLPQDTAFFDANSVTAASKTITMDMPRMSTIDFTNLGNTPTFSTFVANCEIYGSLTLVSGMVWTIATTMNFLSRGSFTLTSAGQSFVGIAQSAVASTMTLQDAFISTGIVTLNAGIFATGGFSVSSVSMTSGASATITLGATTWTLTGTGTVWFANAAINAGTSTIHMTDTGASVKTFSSVVRTYNIVKWTTGGSGAISFAGNATYSSFISSGGGTKTITLAASNTHTFTGGASALPSGTAGNIITYQSSVAGTAATISSAIKLVCDFISLKDSAASGAIYFYAGANSTNVSGNSNWVFTGPLVGGNRLMMGVG